MEFSAFQIGVDIATSVSIIGAIFIYIYNNIREKSKELNRASVSILEKTISCFYKELSDFREFNAEGLRVQKLAKYDEYQSEKSLARQYDVLHAMAFLDKKSELIGYHFRDAERIIIEIEKNNNLEGKTGMSPFLLKSRDDLFKIQSEIVAQLNNRDLNKWAEEFKNYFEKISDIYVELNQMYFDIVSKMK